MPPPFRKVVLPVVPPLGDVEVRVMVVELDSMVWVGREGEGGVVNVSVVRVVVLVSVTPGELSKMVVKGGGTVSFEAWINPPARSTGRR